MLHGISLEVPGLVLCALVGPSGSENQRWPSLLDSGTRGQGQSCIGETDVRDMPLDQLVGLVSFVTLRQFFSLIEQSFENVRLPDVQTSDAEVERALAAAAP